MPVTWHRLFLSHSINGKDVYSVAQKRARSKREWIPGTSDERSAARFEKRNERALAGSTDVPGEAGNKNLNDWQALCALVRDVF